ncbi:Homeodomain-like protein [Camillea tinctor]|nr:Homeodomain-like protein [Camillea tinctor]
MNATERRVPKRWTDEEDKILRDEAQKQGNMKDWNKIAVKLPGRTNKDCRKRWVNKVCGSLKKGAWKSDEDERLVSAVEKHGQKWTLVANEVGFRSPDQCAKRWQSKLDPSLEPGGWTAEEDKLLLTLVRENGREWKKFQEQSFSKRSTNEIKNRHTSLSRRYKRLHNRNRSVTSSSESTSSSDNGADIDETLNDNEDKQMDDEVNDTRQGITSAYPNHQDMTEDWVGMLDIPSVWMDQFGQRQISGNGDVLSGVAMNENPGLLDFDRLNAQPEQDPGISIVPPNNTIPASSSIWGTVQYDPRLDLPEAGDQVLVDPILDTQNEGVFGEYLGNATQNNEMGMDTWKSDNGTVDTESRGKD